MNEDEEFEALEQRLNMKEQEYEQINHPNGVTTWKTKPKVKPEALRLADALDAYAAQFDLKSGTATELRRLHALNQELLEALMECPVWGDKARAINAKAQGASNE